MTAEPPLCAIVPPYVLDRLAEDGHAPATRSLALDAVHRTTRLTAVPRQPAADRLERVISDAGHRERLPGRVVRREGEPALPDQSVNHAYDGLGATYALFSDVYGRHSVDDQGLRLDATVHYGRDYDNAFWDGHRMVFGDGDGEVFGDFTACIDVIGHELAHGVTQFTAGLEYRGQSGALNESVSDVFGSLVKQYALRQDAADADWLIGAGLLAPGVQGVALRSMKAPGTAYDDPRLGKDPQPAHLRDYVHTTRDNGGVHINSGIPNHAFYLLATALGGPAWERAGRIWYDALTGRRLPPDADFTAFARSTVAAAAARYPEPEVADTVTAAWAKVGISPG
ncbi:M4 family metallopeptidase [Streptomyces sp. BE20]|uniref:M4 family metallopeptidase n=1 Tax=unclassified Streptomyces TaxID=2593676 RepID=UPI002E78D2BA|nr:MULTISPECIES: M4 family metallopeptidase [unclassified Streptomyces]MED7953334.1 M4 family metallopeptidase [Streptomyces sp. BE303]MEE1828684.1 M4 family metallopeptidase [Streptomyces sp. BE20]